MSTYTITGNDKDILLQPILDVRAKFDVYDFNKRYLDSIEGGIISGNPSINADSDVRRTLSITIIPRIQDTVKLSKDGLIWLDKKVKYSIGIKNQRTNEYIWYPQGTYIFINTSLTYDSTTNQLSIECSDMTAYLDGSRNGTLPQQSIIYPAYTDYFTTLWVEQARNDGVNVSNKTDLFNWCKLQGDKYNNELVNCENNTITDAAFQLMTSTSLTKEQIDNYMSSIKILISNAVYYTYRTIVDDSPIIISAIRQYYTIGESILNAVSQLGYVDYTTAEIDLVGEAKGMPGYSKNWDYELYRRKNPDWQNIPYDQEFGSGTTVLQIVTTLRDLYENYETFFDIYGNFCCKQIPSGDDDYITFDNDFLQKILISENTSLDFTEVKNITQVFGKVLEPDFFAYNGVSYSDNTFVASISGYDDEYCNGDLIALKVQNDASPSCSLNINNLGKIDVYDENYEIPLDSNLKTGETATIKANHTYVFKIYKKYDSEERKDIKKAYFLGEYQANAMEVLTDGTVGEDYILPTGITVKRNSKEFFKAIYNCPCVNMLINPESPFTIQKIGRVLQVINDDNIISSSTALETAHQENYRKCRLTDNITITTKLCPFADVNQKVVYKPSDSNESNEYLVKSLSHDLQGGTTSWTLMRYYRLYLLPDELLETSGIDSYYWNS